MSFQLLIISNKASIDICVQMLHKCFYQFSWNKCVEMWVSSMYMSTFIRSQGRSSGVVSMSMSTFIRSQRLSSSVVSMFMSTSIKSLCLSSRVVELFCLPIAMCVNTLHCLYQRLMLTCFARFLACY